MRVLVLGGTAFLGRAVVDAAVARGDAVTTFNRGMTGTDRPDVLAVHGDRTRSSDVARLASSGSRDGWDLVVDTSGFVPAVVGDAARRLADRAERYVFVSSLSVYPDFPAKVVDEDAPVHECSPEATEAEYGPGKAGSERAVVEAFGDRAMLARAGLLLGPHENVGRLPWWLRRTARGGPVLAPGRPARPIQVVDVRDVAPLLLDATVSGPVNVTAPPHSATYGELLESCAQVTGSAASLTWVPDEHVLAHEVQPWTELPLWAPENAEFAGVWSVDSALARDAGLTCRSLAQTVADTWAAMQREPLPMPSSPAITAMHGIDPAKEAAVLDAWSTQPGSTA